jgi:hypothetical protein
MRNEVPPPGPPVQPDSWGFKRAIARIGAIASRGFKRAIARIGAIWVAVKRFLTPQSKAEEKCFESRVRRLKTVLQMAIGVAITIMLFVKVCLFFTSSETLSHVLPYVVLPVDILNLLASRHPLAIAGYALAFSAAIDLAYMLFTAGPDEAVEPVILGFASAALIVSAKSDLTSKNAVIIVVLVAGIAVLFWVRETYINDEQRPEPRFSTRRYRTSSESLRARYRQKRWPLRGPFRKM